VFRIGEVARLGGVTSKALRNYDLRGIFHPAWVDPQSGYRYYTPAQLPELRRVIALRDLGIPLANVALLMADGSDLRAVLERRRAELEDTRALIDRKLMALDIRVEMADAGPDVVVRRVESQLIAGLRAGVVPGEDVGALFYELESVVRDARARTAPARDARPTSAERSWPGDRGVRPGD
jgi:DNA-binding transcriptional MerR regulator